MNNSGLTIEVRRKMSSDKANHHAMSPDIDARSLHSETSNSLPADAYNMNNIAKTVVCVMILPLFMDLSRCVTRVMTSF